MIWGNHRTNKWVCQIALSLLFFEHTCARTVVWGHAHSEIRYVLITSNKMAVLSTLKSGVNLKAVAATVTLVVGVGLYIKAYGIALRTWVRHMQHSEKSVVWCCRRIYGRGIPVLCMRCCPPSLRVRERGRDEIIISTKVGSPPAKPFVFWI